MEPKIKIVTILPALIKAGPVIVAYNILKDLPRDMFDLVVVSLREHPMKHRNNKDWFVNIGVDIIEFNYSLIDSMLHHEKIAKKIENLFPSENVIFHGHGHFPALILSDMKNRNTILTVHNRCDEDYKSTYGLIKGCLLSWQYKRCLKNIKKCVPICNSMAEYYSDYSSNMSVVYNGISIDYEKLNKEGKIKLREKLGLPVDKKIFLYPAAFSTRKNQKFIVESIVNSSLNDVIIMFAGMGDLEEECRKAAGADPRIIFLGYQMDMSQYWQVSDYFVSSSLSEGLPMAVLEATLNGLPCILSAIPPHLEILEQLGEKYYLDFNLDDKDAFLKRIEQATSMDVDSNEIANKAKELFTSEVMTNSYVDLYKSFR